MFGSKVGPRDCFCFERSHSHGGMWGVAASGMVGRQAARDFEVCLLEARSLRQAAKTNDYGMASELVSKLVTCARISKFAANESPADALS